MCPPEGAHHRLGGFPSERYRQVRASSLGDVRCRDPLAFVRQRTRERADGGFGSGSGRAIHVVAPRRWSAQTPWPAAVTSRPARTSKR